MTSTFSGCTIRDMRHHVNPILRKKLDYLIIHVGTNSFRDSESPSACSGVCMYAEWQGIITKLFSNEKFFKQLIGVVFIDLKDAFDAIDHNILLRKLRMYGVDTVSIKGFESYLFRRSQKM